MPNNHSCTKNTTHQPQYHVMALQGLTFDFLQFNTSYCQNKIWTCIMYYSERDSYMRNLNTVTFLDGILRSH